MGGDADEVLHQLVLAGEGSQRQALEDVADGLALLGLADQAEGVIDVAAAVADGTHQGLGEIIGGDEKDSEGHSSRR